MSELEEARAEVADWKRRYFELNRAYSVLTQKLLAERQMAEHQPAQAKETREKLTQ